jgi:hypothetical protein
MKGMIYLLNINISLIKDKITKLKTKKYKEKNINKNLTIFENIDTSNIVKTEKNPKNHTCINLINDCVKYVNTSNNNENNHVNEIKNTKNDTVTTTQTTVDLGKKNNVININKNIIITNEYQLLEFYKNNLNNDNSVPNKTVTSKMTGLNTEKIRRLNYKLKNLKKIQTIGKQIYLMEVNENE